MLKRIVTGLLLLPLLPLVLYAAPDWALAACVSLISALAVWELLSGAGMAKRRLCVYASVFAAGLPVWVYLRPEVTAEWAGAVPSAGITLFVLLLFFEAVVHFGKVTFTQIGMAFTAAFCLPFLLSSLIRVMALTAGKYLILLPFIAAFAGDTLAYFVGRKLGRRKLTPVSPNKTAEGAAGGLIGVMLVMAVYLLILQVFFEVEPSGRSWAVLMCAGLFGGAAAQLGDLAMSLIKREFGLKDFGKLLPGHGGVLDRFDSLLFAAPVVELTIVLYRAV